MDADENSRSVTIQNTTAHTIDVQLPATAALGGAYLTLTSGNAKYFGTLFIDSQDNNPAVNGCTYEFSPASASVSSMASNLAILVLTQAGCSYQTVAFDPFVSVPGTTTGTAVISVGFTANTGLARNATIEIAGQPITLTQGSALVNVSVTLRYEWTYGYQHGDDDCQCLVEPGEWLRFGIHPRIEPTIPDE
jgi:hypothetical protein